MAKYIPSVIKRQKHVYTPKVRVDLASTLAARKLKEYAKVSDVDKKLEIIK